MKKLLALILLTIFIISCSKNDPVDDNNTSETVDPDGDDNSGGNSDNGGVGWNGDVFSFGEIDVKSQWTFDGNQSSQGLQRLNSIIENVQINQALIDYEDSLDVGVLSIESPKTGELTSSETVSVIVGNYGYLSVLDSLEISLQVKFEDGEFSEPIVEKIIINDSLPPVEVMEYTFNTTLDLSEKGTYYIEANTQLQGDMDNDNNTHIRVVKSLEYTDVCNIHSLIFNQDNTFNLYTNNQEGVCNYVIFGEYQLEQDSSLLKLYSPDSSQETNLIGNIYDVETDDNGEFTGTIDIEGICVQLEDGYEEENYTEGLTYIPDENLENWLVSEGWDDTVDGYVTNSQAANQSIVAIYATDNGALDENGNLVYGDGRWSNRLTSLAGIEAFPNLETLTLVGNKLDSVNMSQNEKLKYIYLDFNAFHKLDTSNNEELIELATDNNENELEVDFTNNTKLEKLALPNSNVKEIELLNHPNLWRLSLERNSLTSIDLTSLTSLELLYIDNNELSSIDLSNNSKIIEMNLNFNNLKDIDISNLVELKHLSLDGNQLENIDLTKNIKLEELNLGSNLFKDNIDVSNCVNLSWFNILGNEHNIKCIRVNQQQLDALNGVNVPDGFDWALGFYVDENGEQKPVEVSLDCN
jgi:Leucine-rich repeat (LRR) protein